MHGVRNVPECGFRSAKYFLFFTLRKQSYKDKRTEGVVAILVVAALLLSLVPPTPRLSLKFLTKKVFPLSHTCKTSFQEKGSYKFYFIHLKISTRNCVCTSHLEQSIFEAIYRGFCFQVLIMIKSIS